MKIYTAFLFEGHDTAELHCTHKYIGEANSRLIYDVISAFHESRVIQIGAPDTAFDRETFFGDTRVLLPSHPGEFNRFAGLKFMLDKFRSDEFPYNPHVTTNLPFVATKIDSYGICSRDKILYRWYL